MTKAYNLHITQLNLPSEHSNTRDITVSFVTSVAELHQIIQALYWLKNTHLRQFTDTEDIHQSTWDCIPENLLWEERFLRFIDTTTQHSEYICSARNTLLGQFISRKPKIIYYTYDFGIKHMRKIEYKGLAKLNDWIYQQCNNYKGFWCIEDVSVFEQIELMKIYLKSDIQKLKKKYHYRTSRKDFKEYIHWTFEEINIDILNKKLQQLKHISTLD